MHPRERAHCPWNNNMGMVSGGWDLLQKSL